MTELLDDDEDNFVGRRLKSLKRRRPLDLSLGYYLNAKENAPITSISEKQSLIKVEEEPSPSLSAANPTDDNTPVGLKKHASIAKISLSDPPNLQTLESSDQVTVDHFLKASTRSRANATRNYKQARKKKENKRFVQLNDSPNDHVAPVDDLQAPSNLTPKPRKTANNRSRTQRRVRVANSLLVSGVKLRTVLASPPVLHFPWKTASSASGSERHEVGSGTGTAHSRSNWTVPSRVKFLPFGWRNQNQQSNQPRVVRKRSRVPIAPSVPRAALTFETIEEHDKKLDTWLGKSSHGARGVINSKAPGVRGLPPLPVSDDASSGLTQLNNHSRPPSNANDASHNTGMMSSNLPPQGNNGRTNEQNTKQPGNPTAVEGLLTGQKLTHLGDMLGDLRLSAKEFYHASGNGPSNAG